MTTIPGFVQIEPLALKHLLDAADIRCANEYTRRKADVAKRTKRKGLAAWWYGDGSEDLAYAESHWLYQSGRLKTLRSVIGVGPVFLNLSELQWLKECGK